MKHCLSLAFVLMVLWLGNSGHYSPLFLSLGALSVVFAVWVSHRMDVVDHESQPLHLSGHISFFYCWLVGKIILSNIDVVKRIWLGNKSISPCVARLPLSQKTDMGKVIYANSITLTPGTVSMDIEGATVLVHALTAESIAELRGDEMNRRVSDLEL